VTSKVTSCCIRSFGIFFWFGADRLYATLPPDDLVKRAVIFKANPRVKKIVFICAPHRGSYLAANWIGALWR
jgi:hypothetical protein